MNRKRSAIRIEYYWITNFFLGLDIYIFVKLGEQDMLKVVYYMIFMMAEYGMTFRLSMDMIFLNSLTT